MSGRPGGAAEPLLARAARGGGLRGRPRCAEPQEGHRGGFYETKYT